MRTIHQIVTEFCESNGIKILWFGQIEKDNRAYTLLVDGKPISISGTDSEIETTINNLR